MREDEEGGELKPLTDDILHQAIQHVEKDRQLRQMRSKNAYNSQFEEQSFSNPLINDEDCWYQEQQRKIYKEQQNKNRKTLRKLYEESSDSNYHDINKPRKSIYIEKPLVEMLDQQIQTETYFSQRGDKIQLKMHGNVLVKALRNFKSERIPMAEKNIYNIVETAMEEKYKYDLKAEKEENFPKFTYDYLLMHYGLKTIALKNLQSIQMGLKLHIKDKRYQYALLISRLLGFEDQLGKDETRIFIKARKFFNEVQTLWKNKLVEKNKNKVTDDQINNLQNGGICSTFEIMDHFIKSQEKANPQLLEEFVSQLIPESLVQLEEKNPQNDSFRRDSQQYLSSSIQQQSFESQAQLLTQQQIQQQQHKAQIDFIIMRIVSRLQKTGKDIKVIFRNLDTDKTGQIQNEQLIVELNKTFSVFINPNEAKMLLNYLDSDQSNTISLGEFQEKINYVTYGQRINDVTSETIITKARFIQLCFKMWLKKKNLEKEKLMSVFHQFDENGDGVLELREFEVLMRHFDQYLTDKNIAHFFNQTLEMAQSENLDEMSPDAFCEMMIEHKIGGYGRVFFQEYIETFLVQKTSFVKNTKKGQGLQPAF